MIDWNAANNIANAYVMELSSNFSQTDELVITPTNTIEKSYGWVFFYTSKRWLETRRLEFAVGGNAPFLVRRDTGAIHVFGTAQAIEKYLEDYERSLAD